MFFSKLFLVLVLVLLTGQQLSADPHDHAPQQPGNPGSVPQSQARPTAEPPVAPINDAPPSPTNRIPAADQPIDADASSIPCRPPYDAYLDEMCDPDAKRDHLNYILTNGRDFYVGMGPLSRPLQHLQIIAIIAHLKAANEKPVHFQPDTAQYETLANSLIVGGQIRLFKLDQPTVTAGESFYIKMILFRLLTDMKMFPNLNHLIPQPDLDYYTTPEQLKIFKYDVAGAVLRSMESANHPIFDWKTAEAEATSAILEFKQSHFNALDFVSAKDVEKWILNGTEQSIECYA